MPAEVSRNERFLRNEGLIVAMQIGEMLVRAKVLTPSDLDEAIGWQVIYGGRLGTNLLELGLVDEKTLAMHLGRQHGCEWTCGEFDLSESIVRTIPAMVARRQEIVPWRIEGQRFKVLAISPGENMELFDELGFKLGLIVKPVIAPEHRIHQLLRRHFGSSLQMRAIDYGVKPKGPRALEQQAKQEEAAIDDLIDDGAFAAIYANAIAGQSAPPDASFPREVSPPPAYEDASSFLTPLEDDDLMILDAELVEEEHDGEIPAPAAAEPWAAVVADLEAKASTQAVLAPQVAPDRWAAVFAELEAKAATQAVLEPRIELDLSPLSFRDAANAIKEANGRDDVARAVLRYARSKAKRTFLLTLQGDLLTGWHGMGDDVEENVAQQIVVPLEQPSVFRLVKESRSHYIGPLGKDSGNVQFLKHAGKKWPTTAAIMPILFAGRVIYILYTDNGHRQQVDPDVGELLVLAQNITRSVEQMVARKAGRA